MKKQIIFANPIRTFVILRRAVSIDQRYHFSFCESRNTHYDNSDDEFTLFL